MIDAPGCFALAEPSVSTETVTGKAVESPPVDKMLRGSNSLRKGKAK